MKVVTLCSALCIGVILLTATPASAEIEGLRTVCGKIVGLSYDWGQSREGVKGWYVGLNPYIIFQDSAGVTTKIRIYGDNPTKGGDLIIATAAYVSNDDVSITYGVNDFTLPDGVPDETRFALHDINLEKGTTCGATPSVPLPRGSLTPFLRKK